MDRYDIAVVGAGLMGSAAARHLVADFPGMSVCVIGPDEPADRKAHDGVFASHYDQGRITRVLDPSPLWAELARRSMAQYPVIEAGSGIRFHHAVGCLRATDMPEAVAQIDDCAARFKPPHRRLDAEQCRDAFPYLRFSGAFTAWQEAGAAGYINPRSLVQAQLSIAEANGATIARDIAAGIERRAGIWRVKTRTGAVIQAGKLLLTAGGYCNTLLRRKLDLRTKAHTILLAEVAPGESERLKGMPSVIAAFDHDSVTSLYMLPPLPYPDGRMTIKLGPGGRPQELPAAEHFLDSRDSDSELLPWFHSDGRDDIAAAMKAALHAMLPGLKTLSYRSVPCLITYTAGGNPYIDQLDEGLYAATGGNGSAAKSSDAIGRLGALLCAADAWHDKLNRDAFRAVFSENQAAD